MSKRFALVQDNDSHWYIIPADKKAEWTQFVSIPPDDSASWDVPTFAKGIGGGPYLITFTDPQEE